MEHFYKTHQYGLYFAGDGQIITNPKDMFQWHQNIKNSTIGTPEIWKKMFTKAKLNDGTIINFGLGVEFETHNGYKAMGFDGMIKSGFVSKYLYFPELDIGRQPFNHSAVLGSSWNTSRKSTLIYLSCL